MANNTKLEFGEKSLDYIGETPHRLRVVLKNDDGAYYPIFFEPTYIEKSDAELYQMALDVVYEKNSSGRAENERFNLLGKKIAQADEAIEQSEKQIRLADAKIQEMTSQMASQRSEAAVTQATIANMTMIFYEKGLITDEDLLANTENIL